MNDIVEWLRWWEAGAANRPGRYDEAADEVERLRAEVERLRGQRDRLLAAIAEQQSLAPADRVMARVWTAAADVRAEKGKR